MALDRPTQWNWREGKRETALIVSEVFFLEGWREVLSVLGVWCTIVTVLMVYMFGFWCSLERECDAGVAVKRRAAWTIWGVVWVNP